MRSSFFTGTKKENTKKIIQNKCLTTWPIQLRVSAIQEESVKRAEYRGRTCDRLLIRVTEYSFESNRI